MKYRFSILIDPTFSVGQYYADDTTPFKIVLSFFLFEFYLKFQYIRKIHSFIKVFLGELTLNSQFVFLNCEKHLLEVLVESWLTFFVLFSNRHVIDKTEIGKVIEFRNLVLNAKLQYSPLN